MDPGDAKFVTLEGMEGAGKSTNLEFIGKYLEKHGVEFLMTREPGGTEIAESIRSVLLQHHAEKMDSMAELLLMFAARAQHLAKVIRPALAEGKWVVCDRFTDATYAYQGGARNLGFENVACLETLVQGDFRPDLTILLDVPVQVSEARISERGNFDRFEKESSAFFSSVRESYLARVRQDPDRYCVIDASTSLQNVQSRIAAALDELLG